jgi:Flp pilus assembly protein CpaB
MRRMPPRRLGVALTLRRRPRLRTGLVVVVAALTGLVAATTVQGAEDARRAWGQRTPVLVATADVAAGGRLGPDNTRVVLQPAPLVPAGAFSTLPEDTRVALPILRGEAVREERLVPASTSRLAARLPAGTLAVAIPVEPATTPPLEVGDRVEVLVALAPEAAGGGAPGFSLATGVPVVDVSETAVTLAVDRDVAPRLAVAFGQGAVTLAVAAP